MVKELIGTGSISCIAVVNVQVVVASRVNIAPTIRTGVRVYLANIEMHHLSWYCPQDPRTPSFRAVKHDNRAAAGIQRSIATCIVVTQIVLDLVTVCFCIGNLGLLFTITVQADLA